MKVEDARHLHMPIKVKSTDIPNGFFLSSNGALWFKDAEGIVLIDARGNRRLMQRVPLGHSAYGTGGSTTWIDPQPVHGVIRIERNA